MNIIRDILNKIKWTQDFSKVEIWYLHRGAHNDTKILSGKEITTITSWNLETKTSTIPYHRIFRITYDGTTVYERKKL
jgi:uncharacterized protein (UPF0248 family)